MLSVAIDAFRLISEPRTSGAVYVAELVKSLSVLPDIKKLYLLVPKRPGSDFIYTELLNLKNVAFLYPANEVFPARNFRSQIFWIQKEIPHLIRQLSDTTNYYVAPYHHPPIILARGIRIVTIIHDLCGLEARCGYSKNKKGFYRHLMMFLIASIRSDCLIPISKYTQKQLLKHFPYVSSKVSNVVYNGVSSQYVGGKLVEEIIQRYSLDRKKYFIGFGSLSSRKGLDLILDSYHLYRSRGGQAFLVLIVANQARIGVQKMIQKQRLKDVVMVSNIESLERDALYQGALALLFPSRGEGFGYPVVEAMRQGCPPIVWQEGPAMEIVASTVPLLTNLASEEIVAQMSTYESLNSESQAELAERLIKRSFLFNEKNFGQSFFEAMTRTNNLNESATRFE